MNDEMVCEIPKLSMENYLINYLKIIKIFSDNFLQSDLSNIKLSPYHFKWGKYSIKLKI